MATDLADYLVHKGSTFRDAHEVVGKMVRYALDQKKELRELSLEELKTFNRQIEEDVYPWLDPLTSPDRKDLPGGTAPNRVKAAIEKAKEAMED